MLLVVALLVGCLLAVQASANLQLTKAVGTPYGASTIQLSVALALLAVLSLGSLGVVRSVVDVPVWYLLGGLASPLYITSGILLFPRLGALAAVGLFVTGQMFASLGLDLFGLIGVPRQVLTVWIVLGATAVLAGIVLIIRGAAGSTRSTVRAGLAGWIALGVVAGGVLPVQGAVNARLRSALGEPIAVGLVSFTVATLAIAVVLIVLIVLSRTPPPRLRPLAGMPWWGWLGGACAAAYVTATFLLIPEIGAATTIALTVTGQQVASAAIDKYGWFRMPGRALTWSRFSGLALLVAGSALVNL